VTGGGDPEVAPRHSPEVAREPVESLRVLLVEDNAVNQKVATRLLEKRGHQVAVTSNGREALAALEKDTYDVVLMDMQMPEMDGFEATRTIRAMEKGTALHQQIIALTAHALTSDRERCMEAGTDDYLTKPIRPRELDELLESCLQRPKAGFTTRPLAFVSAHNATLRLLIGQFTRRFNQTAHCRAIAVSNIRQMGKSMPA
jgi:CheY-like chemotaxis protein